MNLCRSLLWAILPLILFSAGCTGFKQAYDERVCWKNGLPMECNSHEITLSCSETPSFSQMSKSKSLTKVFVELVDGPANPKVGYLFSQGGDRPIFLTGETPWEILQNDLSAILRSFGLKIQEDKQDIDGIVVGNMTLLDVRTKHGGWLDFKIPTKAQASFEVKVVNVDGSLIWHHEFTGSKEKMVSYAYLKDSQDLLGQAYCEALSDFAITFESTFGTP